MTVENTQNKMPPLQMGTTNEYPFNFAVLLQDPTAEEALEAIKASVLQADGTEIELVYNTDYTVTLNTDRIGGTLTVNDIRTSGDYITIYRQYAQTQEVDYKDFNSAPAETFEQCFDKLTMLSQQQQEEINRSIKLPVSSDITNLSLPNPVAGRTLKWNESETGLINSDVSIDEIDDSVQAALEASINATQQAGIASDAAKEVLEAKEIFEKVKIIATLEIGDIGFTQMAIDETKGLRRKLNGQLIIQDQYVQLTNIIKESVALNPSLACTEAEWQTEVTMNTFGLCGKFVIDDEGGTIRLPKYPNYFIAGLANIAPVVGNGMTLGLTNGKQNAGIVGSFGNYVICYPNLYGKPVGTSSSDPIISGSTSLGVTTDPTKSGIEAQIDEKQIAGTYFIQVATGSETEDNIINEIELNNPFSLLDYKFSEYELNNLSWLRSNGQWNSKITHPAVYDLLLKIYNGTETKAGVSVKLSTDTDATDYDFRINTSDETFRLPIKVKLASGKAVVGNGMTLGFTDGSKYGGLQSYLAGTNTFTWVAETYYGTAVGTKSTNSAIHGGSLGITTDATKSGLELSDSDLYLYFYVGETVQNANLINAGRIEEKLTNYLSKDNKEEIVSWGMPDYTAGVAKSSGTQYTAEVDGWLEIRTDDYNNRSYLTLNGIEKCISGASNNHLSTIYCIIPIPKNTTFKVVFSRTSNDNLCNFYPCKGGN